MPTEGKGPIVIPCYLVDGTPYVLEVDANGKLAVRAAEIETLLGAGLPVALDSLALKVKEQSPISGFATSAKQDTMITALQLIDDLRAALGSVNTDDLQVDVKTMPTVTVQAAGGDKLLSLESAVNDITRTLSLPDGDYTHSGSAVPASKLWLITSMSWTYWGTIPTRVLFQLTLPGATTFVREWVGAIMGRYYDWQGQLFLPAGAIPQLRLINATAGANCELTVYGCQMDAP